MAGSYPNAPGRKMNHYGDGTLCFSALQLQGTTPNIAAGPLVEETGTADHLELVDHDTASSAPWGAVTSPGVRVALFIFPELRDLDGTYINSNSVLWDSASLLYSADTTSGLDGTWTEQSAVQGTIFSTATELPDHRSSIYSWTASAIRGVQVWGQESGTTENRFIRAFEIFGEIAAGESPDRLLFLDNATGLEFLIPQDYGDRPRGSAVDVGARVKNNSGTLSASTIDVTRGNHESTQDSSSWYTMDNGAGFSASFQIASLGSGAEDAFTLRQNIPDSAVLGVYDAWMEYDVNGSWT